MKLVRSPVPTYDVLAKWDTASWDDRTRDVIRRRLTEIPDRRFFSECHWRTLEAVAGRLLPQPDRVDPIPIVPWIDEKLHHNLRDGFRFDDMPSLPDAWRFGLDGIEEESRRMFGNEFVSLAGERQDAVLRAVQAGDVTGAAWQQVSAARFFSEILLKEIVGEYYAHPSAWNEAGFGGPASPRGYVRLGPDQRDPWEAPADDGSS